MTEFKFHTYQNKLPLKNKVGRLLWNIYAVLFFRTMPTKYLNFVRVAGLRLFGAKIGFHGAGVHRTARIWAPWNLIMEDYTLIDRDCRIYNPGLITIMRETIVSENVYLCTASHNVHSIRHELVVSPITLRGKNWIAADVMILPGVEIGEGAVVAARAVVTKSVSPWKIVGGNPAVVIGCRELDAY